ncbi:hypothetical protein ALT761_03297 [Alteromonas sp. 76-1]|jgi:hypothetical protein|uniref:hypothetical protein n=1 Tax=Alteromonas TaxID=226 RepID=UPI000FD17C8A|nr:MULTISPECIES: hypothetical protein [Alteromonas]MCQ8848420.1 hypothetical protein [Alteromonas stellipolaris]VEL98280.1 hypothetical protein ALT761_03297 [Alteromonas sp. 76-1]|tara:strand:- start:172 stop:369 length:198 start_codon:yes stop_codon:yes gene_type:complete
MDDSNQHLKDLLSQTDLAFKALMRQPNSSELTNAYDNAKAELDAYMKSLRNTLSQRKHLQRQKAR